MIQCGRRGTFHDRKAQDGCSGAWMPSLASGIFGDCGQARQGQEELVPRGL